MSKILTKSIWVYHFAAAPCNNCDIEILDVLTPKFDAERFGVKLIGSIRHADCM
ncbi:NADH:ubiquinone oxidoreductase, partial [Elusimicrobiota bacterium]